MVSAVRFVFINVPLWLLFQDAFQSFILEAMKGSTEVADSHDTLCWATSFQGQASDWEVSLESFTLLAGILAPGLRVVLAGHKIEWPKARLVHSECYFPFYIFEVVNLSSSI